MGKSISKVLFWLFFIVLALPLVQSKFLYHFFQMNYLNEFDGFDPEVSDTTISLPGWFSGDFQMKKERCFNRNYGFRNIFIRLNFQVEWDLFRNIPNNRLILGKENFLFYKPCVAAYNGTDFASIDSIKFKVTELKYFVNALEKLDKKFILIFAPNAADIYSEYLPDSLKTIKGPTNYGTYVNLLRKESIDFIDFNSLFRNRKNKSPFPLFTPFSSHYSVYGACIAGDSIIKYINYATGKDLPHARIDSINKTSPKEYDADLRSFMNLIVPLKYDGVFAYPTITVVEKTTTYKPNVLIISDSYFKMLIKYYHILDFFSKQSRFWYYNRSIYAGAYEEKDILKTMPKDIDIKNEILKYDLVIIMSSIPSLQSLSWGFLDKAYN